MLSVLFRLTFRRLSGLRLEISSHRPPKRIAGPILQQISNSLAETGSRKALREFPTLGGLSETPAGHRRVVDRAGFEPAALRSRVSAFPQTGSDSRTCQAGDLRPDNCQYTRLIYRPTGKRGHDNGC